jgi:hypothetical protein
MPTLKEGQLPKYRLHKQSGQAIVTLRGRDVLLGSYDSAASQQKYKRVTAEWLASTAVAPALSSADELTINHLILAFWHHAKAYYRGPDGQPTSEQENLRQALRPLRRLYGRTLARDFGPSKLKTVQSEMVRMGWCRTYINRQVPRIRMLFKWAVSNELAPAEVHHGLATVSGLRAGRSDARESNPVKPVAESTIQAALNFVSNQVRDGRIAIAHRHAPRRSRVHANTSH